MVQKHTGVLKLVTHHIEPTSVGDGEVLTEEKFREVFSYRRPEEISFGKKVKKAVVCSPSTMPTVFPILKWLPQYRIRRDFVADLLAGLTVAVVHIPHGLAFAPIAGQAPVVGLYMAVFPTLMYLFLGTSRHFSLGTNASVCIMVGTAVSTYVTQQSTIGNGTVYSNLEVGVTICFLVGFWQVVMGSLNLGSVWLVLSNSFVSGYTAGISVHVVVFQLSNFLGVPAGGFSGPLKLLYNIADLVTRIPETNLVTFGISCCAIFILSSYNELLKPLIQRKFPNWTVPVPIELMVIVPGIAVSYFLDLEAQYDVHIIKSMPVGLPKPVLPVPELFPALLFDSFLIAIVGFSSSVSLAAIFTQNNGCEIRQNQELFALGASNVFAAFFQCAPASPNFSRSWVQCSAGGKTQIASVFSLVLIIFILLFLGPFFEPMPFSISSSIVVVALKGLLWQVNDVPEIWRLSKLDGLVWVITFLSVVLIDLDIGLGVGIAASVLTLILQEQTPSVVQLGNVPDSNLFLDASLYKNVLMLPNILILKVSGGLHFANFTSAHGKIMKFYIDFQRDKKSSSVVLDMSCVPSLDPTSVNKLLALYKNLKIDNCSLILTSCNAQVYDFLQHCNFFDDYPKRNVLVSTFVAVEFLTSNKNYST